MVAGGFAPLPAPSLQDLARLFLSLSGPFAQRDAVGASLFSAAGVTGAGALPGPAALVMSSAHLACASANVPASGVVSSAGAASATSSSGRHKGKLGSLPERHCRRSSSGGGGPVQVRSVARVGPLPLLALPVRLMRPPPLRLRLEMLANRRVRCLLPPLGVLALVTVALGVPVEDDHSISFDSVDLDRDDSFQAVLRFIWEFHSMEEPASVAP